VTTNARYITLVEDVIAPEDAQLQKSRENELKILLVSDSISVVLCYILQKMYH
jgi:hypothetical protein